MWQNFLNKRVNNFEYLGQLVTRWLDQHLVNIIIILIGAYVFRKFGTKSISRIMHKTVRRDLYPTEIDRKKRIKTLDNLIGAMVRAGTWMVAAFMIINELGINTAPLLASAGVAGLAIGFGAQSLIKDFVSGIFIITEHQYRVGDIVEIGLVQGTVEAITIRTTIIRDLNGDLHHVPNGTITVTTNKTMDFGSINEDIIVAGDTDLTKLEHIINHVGEEVAAMPELKDMIREAPYFSSVKGFDPLGIRVKVMGKTTTGDAWRVKSEFYRRLAKAFDKQGIEIPYTQLPFERPAKKKKQPV
jgi:small conductance mechanosensitive channel